MFYLLASIISSTAIYTLFRIAKNYQCNLNSIITLNYLVATLFGLAFFNSIQKIRNHLSFSWIPFAVVLGILFIAVFYLIGNSSQKAGVTVTTLANKLSLVFPVMLSLAYFDEKLTAVKFIGLGMALVAISFTVYKKEIKRSNLVFIVLPLLIFFGSGLVDSLIKFVQEVKTEQQDITLFTTTVFIVAFCCGLVLLIFRKINLTRVHLPTILLGTMLGLANFGSLFFIFEALNKSNLASSLVFSVNNMSVVLFSAIIGWFVFSERMNRINYLGILLALLSLYFLLHE